MELVIDGGRIAQSLIQHLASIEAWAQRTRKARNPAQIEGHREHLLGQLADVYGVGLGKKDCREYLEGKVDEILMRGVFSWALSLDSQSLTRLVTRHCGTGIMMNLRPKAGEARS